MRGGTLKGPVERIYLDWNASAPLSPGALAAATHALTLGGNASSVHGEGRAARQLVERTRAALASRFAVPRDQVLFTSGGTEANATALCPGILTPAGRPVERLIASAVEHPAVLAGGRFDPTHVHTVPVDANGVIDKAGLSDALSDGPPSLVSVMAANNETGVLQPLAEIAAIAADHDALLHTDAVQAFGRIPDEALVADLITLSGHKLGGPVGAGALIRRRAVELPALVRGGGQEKGMRGGTENVTAIAGLGAALSEPAADPNAWAETKAARIEFEAALKERFSATVFGEAAPRLPNTTLAALPGMPAEIALIALDLAGTAISSGSACSSGKVATSHVLAAMGVSQPLADTALRISAGPIGAAEAYERFLLALGEVIVSAQRRAIS